jgi:hypothetical protein
MLIDGLTVAVCENAIPVRQTDRQTEKISFEIAKVTTFRAFVSSALNQKTK